MDAVAVLSVAGAILSFAQLGTELLSPSTKSYGNRSIPLFDATHISERLRELESTLSSAAKLVGARVGEHDLAASSLFEEAAASCLGDIRILLEQLRNVKERIESGGQLNLLEDMEAAFRSSVFSRLPQDKIEHLSKVVTVYVSSVVGSRIIEIEGIVDSLKGDSRYTRPEHESRVDSMAQDLASLQAELSRISARLERRSVVASFSPDDISTIQSLMTRLDVEDHIIVDRIVASLNYDSRPVRHDSVPQAHKDTFRWAFDSQLADWFRSGNGTFWVSGKPGSGKSTFMKFISSHKQTKELLSSWAGSTDKLAIAAHFFWIAGTPIQKSWQGLFQSLLFDTFHKQPAVVRLICPSRWAAARKGNWQEAAEPWSVTELGVALRALATTPEFPLKLCFFIDGLDEYDSDHSELCDILYDMASSSHIKICLSSRPWPVFEERFGTDDKKRIDIHELTKDDILQFVIDQLQWPDDKDSEISDEERDEICQQIATGADGVFLWAFFVTKSLREAVSKGATVTDLRNRLRGLPSDLEQLFRTMLESVDKVSHPKMAGILQAASNALEPLHIDLYWMLEKEFESRDYAHHCPIQATSWEERSKQRENTTRSVSDKTKGLLKLVNQRFEFLHRTVKDFVLTKDMGEYLRGKLPAGYNGYIAIAAAYLGFLKTTSFENSIIAGVVRLGQGRNSGPFTSHLNQALTYTSEALKSNESPELLALLGAFEKSVDQMIRSGHVTLRGPNAEGCDSRLLFREELLRHNLTPFIKQRLREEAGFFDVFDEPPFYSALMPMSLSSGESPAPVPAVLDILLRYEENPNNTTRDRSTGISNSASGTPSPWVLFARDVMSVFNMLTVPCNFPAIRFNDTLSNGIFDLLLSHGADSNASLLPDRPIGAHTAFSHFLGISLSQFLGPECYEGYLRTLGAFLRAGASLGVPSALSRGSDFRLDPKTDDQKAFGNLARERPDESVLTSFCTELETLLSRLAADPGRANFIQSVVTILVIHCSGLEEELRQIASAVSKGCPEYIHQILLPMIERELARKGSTKRSRGSWDGALSNSAVKHLRH
ncbi:hypothetical protein BKA67DRAFT_660917 [Truncatella angustata]|uniref:Nephrocystin 3-like N-terminal domain-containing protein n=1 Tax=Truncatella angustata TaxID=152316 RepID=A0A9P8UH84_9PEZI|nr:uncharacterized protein BKA67DRAFT_660917 [Truncatella angustata]KAH6652150.1 hypothetical protein BKA67DRAFT_660917 [Truncatella angustata]